MRRKSILLLTAGLGLVAGVFAVTLLIVWQHDPMDAVPRVAALQFGAAPRSPATGPLRQSAANPRYFAGENGRAIYLTGSHVWNNFQEKSDAPNSDFDYAGYLRFLEDLNHNFVRLWVWEQAAWAWTNEKVVFSPLPYVRTGPGVALDGDPKFDLTQFNQAYFDRLRSRVKAAGDRGIYVSVMLFQGWSVGRKPGYPGNPWKGHPFNLENNVNGVDGDQDKDGEGRETHTLATPAIRAWQERYVGRVIDTLNDLDNVLWEISNESDPDARQWQYHMINFIKNYEATKPLQHPVGMTALGGPNADLFESPADWISPSDSSGDYRQNPAPGLGKKVIIADTDHLWGVGGDRDWVWKSFTRGLNPIFMDLFDDARETKRWKTSLAKLESCRRAMGQALAYGDRMNLNKAVPHGELASSSFCLADPGEEYLIYIPFEAPELPARRWSAMLRNPIRNLWWQFKRKVTVDLSNASSEMSVEWFSPASGEVIKDQPIKGGQVHSLKLPFRGDGILFIRKNL